MARPFKQGLDYFPLDVDFFNNHKVRRLIMAAGAKAPTVLIYLLSTIYKNHGYYMLWDADMLALCADDVGLSEGAVRETVEKAVKVKFFDANMLETYGVLTSRRIQENFFSIIKALKRKSIRYDARFLFSDVINEVNSGDNGVIYINNTVNSVDNTQKKRKEKKGNEKEVEGHTVNCDNEKITKLMQVYQNNIHPVCSLIEKEKLVDLLDSYGLEAVIKAIERAVIRGKRNIGYIAGILSSWQVNGYDNTVCSKENSTDTAPSQYDKIPF